MALGQTKLLVEGLTDWADRAIAHDGQLRMDIHSGHETVGWSACAVHALVGEAQPLDFFI
jgi:hypothetical protein